MYSTYGYVLYIYIYTIDCSYTVDDLLPTFYDKSFFSHSVYVFTAWYIETVKRCGDHFLFLLEYIFANVCSCLEEPAVIAIIYC